MEEDEHIERRIGRSGELAAAAAGARHREGEERCGEQRRERPKQPAAAGAAGVSSRRHPRWRRRSRCSNPVGDGR